MADEPQQSWEAPDYEELQEDLANSYSGFAESWKPQQGDNKIRLCPRKRGAKLFLQINQHYGIGPKNRTYPCARSINEDEACILCDIAEELKTSDDPAKQAEYKSIRAGKRFLCNIVDLAALDKGIQVWRAPTTVFRTIAKVIPDPEFQGENGEDITHPMAGRNLKVTVTGAQKNTEYTVQVMPTQTKFPLELSVLDDLPDLQEAVTFSDDQEMEAAYYDTGEGEDPDDGYEPARADDVREPGDLPEGEEYQPDGDPADPVDPEPEVEAEPEAPVRRRPLAPTPVRRAPAAPVAPVRRTPARPAASPAKVERAPVGRAGAPQTARRPTPAANGSATRTEVRRKAATARSR